VDMAFVVSKALERMAAENGEADATPSNAPAKRSSKEESVPAKAVKVAKPNGKKKAKPAPPKPAKKAAKKAKKR